MADFVGWDSRAEQCVVLQDLLSGKHTEVKYASKQQKFRPDAVGVMVVRIHRFMIDPFNDLNASVREWTLVGH